MYVLSKVFLYAGSKEMDVLRAIYQPESRGNRRVLLVPGCLERAHARVSRAICDRQRVLLHRGESRAAAALSSRR